MTVSMEKGAGVTLTLESAAAHVPMWTDWGVRDAGPWVHSLGCSFLTAAGRDHGFAAVAEAPAPRVGPLAHAEEDVRSDSVWFDRTTRDVALLAEFERYRGKQTDLPRKVEALLLAQQRWGNEEAVLLLGYWSVGWVNLPDHEQLRRIARAGYSATGGVKIPGNPRARLIFYQFVLRAGRDGTLRLAEILRRGEA